MRGVFLRSIFVIRSFSYGPIDGRWKLSLGLPAVVDSDAGLDAAIASSLAVECEAVDRGKCSGCLLPLSLPEPSSLEWINFCPDEVEEPTLIRFRDTDFALAPDV